jgi:hypothetical protein
MNNLHLERVNEIQTNIESNRNEVVADARQMQEAIALTNITDFFYNFLNFFLCCSNRYSRWNYNSGSPSKLNGNILIFGKKIFYVVTI